MAAKRTTLQILSIEEYIEMCKGLDRVSNRKQQWLIMIEAGDLTCPVTELEVDHIQYEKVVGKKTTYHYNFFSKCNRMFTVDHITAKSNGGKEMAPDNLQPMIDIYNTMKGSTDLMPTLTLKDSILFNRPLKKYEAMKFYRKIGDNIKVAVSIDENGKVVQRAAVKRHKRKSAKIGLEFDIATYNQNNKSTMMSEAILAKAEYSEITKEIFEDFFEKVENTLDTFNEVNFRITLKEDAICNALNDARLKNARGLLISSDDPRCEAIFEKGEVEGVKGDPETIYSIISLYSDDEANDGTWEVAIEEALNKEFPNHI